jgi:hypothetical protein
MDDIEFNDREGTLEFAMIVAIALIADMDESLPEGSATVVPEEVLRMLEKSAPMLMSEVTQCGFREQLLSHLADYGLLRQLVPNWVDLEAFLDSHRRMFFEDLLYVLEAEDWKTSRPAFHSLFLSIVPVIRPRLEARCAIPW